MDSVFGFPRLIRFSWQTCSDLLAKEAVAVVWPEDLEDEQQQGKSNKKQKQVKLSSLIKPKCTRQHVYGDLGLRHVKDF
jgi:ribonuclease H2 subunit A